MACDEDVLTDEREACPWCGLDAPSGVAWRVPPLPRRPVPAPRTTLERATRRGRMAGDVLGALVGVFAFAASMLLAHPHVGNWAVVVAACVALPLGYGTSRLVRAFVLWRYRRAMHRFQLAVARETARSEAPMRQADARWAARVAARPSTSPAAEHGKVWSALERLDARQRELTIVRGKMTLAMTRRGPSERLVEGSRAVERALAAVATVHSNLTSAAAVYECVSWRMKLDARFARSEGVTADLRALAEFERRRVEVELVVRDTHRGSDWQARAARVWAAERAEVAAIERALHDAEDASLLAEAQAAAGGIDLIRLAPGPVTAHADTSRPRRVLAVETRFVAADAVESLLAEVERLERESAAVDEVDELTP